MLLKIACMLTCRIRGLVVLMCRGDQAKDAELLVLRHEDAVLLRRQSGQVRYEPADRSDRMPRRSLTLMIHANGWRGMAGGPFIGWRF